LCIGKKAVIAAAAAITTAAAAAAAAARDLQKAGCCSSLRYKDPVTSLSFLSSEWLIQTLCHV